MPIEQPMPISRPSSLTGLRHGVDAPARPARSACCGRRLAVQQHQELVAAQARHAVRLDQAAQALRHALQQAVAELVAEGLVDMLEAVQRHHQQHHLAVLPVGLLLGLRQRAFEADAVGQAGQIVASACA